MSCEEKVKGRESMCGILMVIYDSSTEALATKVIHCLEDQLNRRGHDSINHALISLPNGKFLFLKGFVLAIRGGGVTSQPVSNGRSLLLWNGEVFDGLKVGREENDTEVVFKALEGCHGDASHILNVWEEICGPWATVYWEESTSSLWIGRDVLGRRSLVWHLPQSCDDIFVVSSVGNMKEFPHGYWSEVPALGLYVYDAKGKERESLHCHLWRERETDDFFVIDAQNELKKLATSLHIKPSDERLQVPFCLLNSSIPQVPSDSVVIVAKTESTPDAVRLLELLQEAVEKRLMCSRTLMGRAMGQEVSVVRDSRVAVLFSGGLDSAVLAALTDRCLDPEESIDLINVAFNQSKDPNSPDFNVPDRLSALKAVKELNPERKWNLILVNVLQEEVVAMRNDHIHNCVHPLVTVLDDSLGCAMWFAARGKGILLSGEPYLTRAKILLVGVGADEQLAGYSRHRTQYRHGGMQGLITEVQKDIKRLSHRNLGRDDRCIGDHHREGRFPYLDEKVVDFLNGLPMHIKANLELPRGEGEKRLLREVALMLGCNSAASLPKRALQFGSRAATLQGSAGGKGKGSDTSEDLLSN